MTMTGNNSSTNCTKDDFKYVLYSSVFSIVLFLGCSSTWWPCTFLFADWKCATRPQHTCWILCSQTPSSFSACLSGRSTLLNRQWPFGDALCKISVALFYTNMYGSILFLTCISMDRFLAIVYPFASRTLRTKRNARIACCVIWVFLLSGGLTASFVMDNTSSANNKTYCFENYSNSQWKSTVSKVVVFIETVGFLIPLMINFICSMKVLQTLRHKNTINRGGQLNKAKILRMIVVHLFIFCFCFIPFNVNLVFYTLVRSQVITNCTVESVVRTIYPIAFCIAVTNCCFDPVIYYFTSETIQNSIKRKSYAVGKNNTIDNSVNRNDSMNKMTSPKVKFILEESTI